jgi:hypothetical protein
MNINILKLNHNDVFGVVRKKKQVKGSNIIDLSRSLRFAITTQY